MVLATKPGRPKNVLDQEIDGLSVGQSVLLNADEAWYYGHGGLPADNQLKITLTPAGTRLYTIQTPDKWQFQNAQYDAAGNLVGLDQAISPDGVMYNWGALQAMQATTGTPPVTTPEPSTGTPPIAPPVPGTAGITLDTSLSKLFPEMYAAFGAKGTLQTIQADLATNAKNFSDKFLGQGRSTESDYFLANVLGLDAATIDKLYASTGAAGVTPSPGAPVDSPQYQEISLLAQKAMPLLIKPNSADKMLAYFSERPDEMRRNLTTAGRNADTEALVRALYPKITDQGMKDYFNPRHPEVIEGVNAGPTAPQSVWSTVVNAWNLAANTLGHETEQFFLTTVPNFFTSDNFLTRQLHIELTDNEKEDARTYMAGIAKDNNQQFENWKTVNPQLTPPAIYAEGVASRPELLKDPKYWAYVIASNAPFSATALGVTILTTTLTGNPLAGALTGMAVLTPAQSQQVYDAMIAAGATVDQAANMAVPVGIVLSSVEMAGDLPFLKAVSPAFMNAFRKNATTELTKATLAALAKKGLSTFTEIEFSETLEEVVQQAIQNAAVKTIDEKQGIFEGMTDTIIQTLMATAPTALIGGASSVRTLASQRMKVDLAPQYNAEVKKALDAGQNQAEAELSAVTVLAATPQGQAILADVIRNITGVASPSLTAQQGAVNQLGASDAGMAKIVTDIYDAIVKDLAAGQQIPVATYAKTTYLTTPAQVRLSGQNIQISEGGKWVTVSENTLNHWADVKKLPTPIDYRMTVGNTPREPWAMTLADFEEANYNGEDVTSWANSPEKAQADKLLQESQTLGESTSKADKDKADDLVNQAQSIADAFYEKHNHRVQVEAALAAGKEVPAAVLADYPDLTSTSAKTVPFSASLDIRNVEALPHGTGARYLITIKGQANELIAKQWARKIPAKLKDGEVVVDMEPGKTTAPAAATLPNIQPINKKVAGLIEGRKGIPVTITDEFPIQGLHKGDNVIAYPVEGKSGTYDILTTEGLLAVGQPDALFSRSKSQESTPVSMNFTQYATSKGMPSDYDVVDHGTLSPSGHVSNRSRKAAQDAQAKRAADNLKTHEEYRAAILAGEIVDPSGQVVKEELVAQQKRTDDKGAASQKQILEGKIQFIESLGGMSHLANGKLRKNYQSQVDQIKADLAALQSSQADNVTDLLIQDGKNLVAQIEAQTPGYTSPSLAAFKASITEAENTTGVYRTNALRQLERIEPELRGVINAPAGVAMPEVVKPQLKNYELIETDYVKSTVAKQIRRYINAIEQQKKVVADYKKRKVTAKALDKEEITLRMWQDILERLQNGDWQKKNENYLHEQYVKMLKKAISTGEKVPAHVIAQAPEYSKALDARARYEKGLHTSFANKSIAVNDEMKAEAGYKVKRQDGKPITQAQMAEIDRGVKDIESVLGPLHDLFLKTDITIAHTSGLHPFLSGFGGLYSNIDKTVTIGTGTTKAFAHEVAHWLDYESGKEAGAKAAIYGKTNRKRYDTTSASEATVFAREVTPLGSLISGATRLINDTYEVSQMMKESYTKGMNETEKAEVVTIKQWLSPYWRERREVWARLVEQYVATKIGKSNDATAAPESYQKWAGWWTKDVFDKLMPLVEAQVKDRIAILRGSTELPAARTTPSAITEYQANRETLIGQLSDASLEKDTGMAKALNEAIEKLDETTMTPEEADAMVAKDYQERWNPEAADKRLIATIRNRAKKELDAGKITQTQYDDILAAHPEKPTTQNVREYWDTTLERNDLKLRKAENDSEAGASLSYRIENAGDILREWYGNQDYSYLKEKWNKLMESLEFKIDWNQPLTAEEDKFLDIIKVNIRNMPTPEPMSIKLKTLIEAVAERSLYKIRQALENINTDIEGVRNTEAPTPTTLPPAPQPANVVVTVSGRRLEAPSIRVTTNRIASKDSLKADLWLYEEAKKELGEPVESGRLSIPGSPEAAKEFQRDAIKGIKPGKMTQADKDTLWMILTGNPDAPAVFKLVDAKPSPVNPGGLDVTLADGKTRTIFPAKFNAEAAKGLTPDIGVTITETNSDEIFHFTPTTETPAATTPAGIEMLPSTSVQTGLAGFGKESAQIQMFGEVSGKTSEKMPLTAPPVKGMEQLPGQTSMEDVLTTEEPQTVEEGIAQENADREELDLPTMEEDEMDLYKRETELQVQAEALASDPVANYKIEVPGTRIIGRKSKNPKQITTLTHHGLDSPIFRNIKEGGFATGDTFSKGQAAILMKASGGNIANAHLTKDGRVGMDEALDAIAQELTGGDIQALVDRVNEIIKIKKELKYIQGDVVSLTETVAKQPILPIPEPEPTEFTVMVGGYPATVEQVDALVGWFVEYINSPSALNATELTRELQRKTRAERAEKLVNRTEQLIAEGIAPELAMKQAQVETLTGKLPRATDEYITEVTGDLRDALFAKVFFYFKDKSNEVYERTSTITALTNLLANGSLPREPGSKGGSAYTRLQRVFGPETLVIKAFEKVAEQQKSLEDIVVGVFRDINEWQAPMPIDKESADYLRSLQEKPSGKPRLGEEYQSPASTENRTPEQIRYAHLKLMIEIASKPGSYQSKYITELALEKDIPETLKLDYEKALHSMDPPQEVMQFETPIMDAFKEMPLIPPVERHIIVTALKEAGLTAIDIGNFLRANKASFDFSWWRQQAPLILNHKTDFIHANIAAWRAMWNTKAAEAEWLRILHDPLYQYYEQSGYDFLRPLFMAKGTAQWQSTEEFGYAKGTDRPIPKFTEKIPWVKVSERAFITGTNVHNWRIFRDYYNATMRLNSKIASGEVKLKPGEAFIIQDEMTDLARMLADFTGRAKLGKASGLAPVLSAFFFAPRYKLGRILTPTHLFSANPRIRLEAFKDLAMFITVTGGIMLLGKVFDLWDVETDERSADFMKIRIGKMHIDPWGGYQQLVVFASRLIEKTGVSSITGQEYDVDLISALGNFIRGAQSPLLSLMTDLYTGKTFIGETVDFTNWKQWADRMAPMSLVDMYEAFRDSGLPGWVSGPAVMTAFLGAGVQTYTGDWVENAKKIGLPKYNDNLPFSITKPSYDVRDFWSDVASKFKGVEPKTLTPERGYPPYIRAIAEAAIIKDFLGTMPNQSLKSLNADIKKGDTYREYYFQWQQRQKLVTAGDEEALKEFDKQYPQAHLGNIGQRGFALLNEYYSITDKKVQADFLAAHPELSTNPRTEWLTSHPKENAQLAVWGQAEVYTQAAYDEAQRLAKVLDIPESALEEYLPPKEIANDLFTFQGTSTKFGSNSWEAQLALAKNDKLREYLKRDISDTPIAALEIKVKNRGLFNLVEGYADKDSPDYIADEKKRAAAVSKLKTDNPGFADDLRRIDAISLGSNGIPIDSKLVDLHVTYGRILDTPGKGASSFEAMLFRVDNPEYDAFRTDENLWGDQALKPIDKSQIPIWRIDAQYAKEDTEYNTTIPGKYKGMTDGQVNAMPAPAGFTAAGWQARPVTDKRNTMIALDREKYLTTNKDYAVADIKRAGYQLGLADGAVLDSWVKYNQLPLAGPDRDLFRVDNPDYEAAINAAREEKGQEPLAPIPPERVPVLRINKRFAKEDAAYQAILDKYGAGETTKQSAEIKAFLEDPDNADYALGRIQRDGYTMGLKDAHISNWVEYSQLPTTGFWRERYRLEHPDFEKAVNVALNSKGQKTWSPLEQSKVLPETYDKLYDQYKDLFEEYANVQGTTAARTKARKDIFDGNPAFREAYYLRAGYEKGFGDDLVDDYANYNLIPESGYARERYLAEHPAFYRTAFRLLGWKDLIDFEKVPSERVEALYNQYLLLPDTGGYRESFRKKNPDLEDWLLLTKKTTRSISGKQSELNRQAGLMDAALAKIEGKLAGVK